MSNNYEIPQDNPQMVSESISAYRYPEQPHSPIPQAMTEMTNEEKKVFLRENLHPSTAAHLESVDWMENKPYPVFEDSDDESWIDQAEANGSDDIIAPEVIRQDSAAWKNLRLLV